MTLEVENDLQHNLETNELTSDALAFILGSRDVRSIRSRIYTKLNTMKNVYLNDDSLEVMKHLQDKSVDLIFTSPPHISECTAENEDEFKKFQSDFTREFSRIIKDTGFVVLCQAQHRHEGFILSNYVSFFQNMTSHGLRLKDEKIVYRKGPVGRKDLYRFTYQIMTVWTRRGSFKRAGDFVADTFIDNQELGKGTTKWTQRFCSFVIENLTKPGDFVLDPFAGTASVLICAKSLGRDFLGCEINKELYDLRSHLLSEIEMIQDIPSTDKGTLF